MERRKLVLIFTKNALYGKVKTRLAKSIGDDLAFEVFGAISSHTRRIFVNKPGIDTHVYLSESLHSEEWSSFPRKLQIGSDLGERMSNAFVNAFDDGYTDVIGIGTDLPEINAPLIDAAFEELNEVDVVLGPAIDGGYYLIGMTRFHPELFEGIEWSKESVLRDTLAKTKSKCLTVRKLPTMNDVDTVEDLICAPV